ncbi:unnamed protein product, partial [Phaeothamnion confervicola]
MNQAPGRITESQSGKTKGDDNNPDGENEKMGHAPGRTRETQSDARGEDDHLERQCERLRRLQRFRRAHAAALVVPPLSEEGGGAAAAMAGNGAASAYEATSAQEPLVPFHLRNYKIEYHGVACARIDNALPGHPSDVRPLLPQSRIAPEDVLMRLVIPDDPRASMLPREQQELPDWKVLGPDRSTLCLHRQPMAPELYAA